VTRFMSCGIELRDELVQVGYDVPDKDAIYKLYLLGCQMIMIGLSQC
jgi:hypothetical protein